MLRRKNKEDVFQDERDLAQASSGVVAPEVSHLIQAYTLAARHFEESVAAGEKRTAQLWRRVAIFCMALAFLAVGAVVGLTPLKQVEPYLVRVDKNTGFTDIVAPLDKAADPDQIEDELWISTYVHYRQSYSFADQQQRYEVVRLFSYADTFAEYRNFQLSSKGYTEVLGDRQLLRIQVNNIVFLPDPPSVSKPKYRTAQVRYTTTPVDRLGQPIKGLEPTTWLVTLSFDYNNPPKNRQQRWINPKGFGVVAYSQAQEVRQ